MAACRTAEAKDEKVNVNSVNSMDQMSVPAMNLDVWTIEADIPFIELDAPTRRVPFPVWCSDPLGDDEAPTRVNGKVRVFGDPIALNKRPTPGKRRVSIPSPKHADGPGPSIHSVVTRYIGE